MPVIVGVDPGTNQSAYFVYDSTSKKILAFGKIGNETFLNTDFSMADVLVYEKMQNYGSPVGQTTFETCIWMGRFIQEWHRETNKPIVGLFRHQIKSNLCPKMKSNDSKIREALINRFGKPGSKKNPGPTYGIVKDIWSAMAIAVTYGDRLEKGVN